MGRYLATGKSLIRLGWKDGKDLFSVTGCACVTHRRYALFVCFFSRWPDRDRLIVVRQKTISHHVIHFVFVYVVGRWLGLASSYQVLVQSQLLSSSTETGFLLSIESIHFFFKEIENCLVPSSSTALFHTIFWLYEGKGLEVKEFESLLIHQSCILICPKNILKSITIQKNVDCFDSKIEIQFI